jgi:glycerophosphoryl diester phosphodiesterase
MEKTMKVLMSLSLVLWILPGFSVQAAELLIAHRGVHQNFSTKNLDNKTCTAERISKPSHAFLENTLPSMAEAFRLGADIVEIDVQATKDGQVVVFHDWMLDCRTNGQGKTEDQSLAYLRSLDIGYGYTHDNHLSHPFRCVPERPDYQACRKRNRMPTLEEVLLNFPNKRFALNPKSANERSLNIILSKLEQISKKNNYDLSRLFWISGKQKVLDQARQVLPQLNIPKLGKQGIKTCLKNYFVQSSFAPACQQATFALPYSKLKALEPRLVKQLIRDIKKINGQLIATGVNTKAAYHYLSQFDLDGIWTDKIIDAFNKI